MSATYWDSSDLKAIQAGGLINEDVMQQIFDISDIPLPFTDLIGTGGSAEQAYTEWTKDKLADPDVNNANVSGADATGNDAKGGERVGNHCQIPDKVLKVTHRARSSDTIGRADELAYQLMERGKEIRRDVEAISLRNQASVEDDGDTVAGKLGGFDAWLETNVSVGATGAVGGFNPATKVVDQATNGTARALTYTLLTDEIDNVYAANGDPSVLMSVPLVCKRLSRYLLTNPDGVVAQPTANVSGTAPAEQTAQGYVNVLVTDYGFTMRIVPNRLQQLYAGAATLFGIDPARAEIAFLEGYRTDPLGKPGLSDHRQMSADVTLKVYNEEAHMSVRDIDPTQPVTT